MDALGGENPASRSRWPVNLPLSRYYDIVSVVRLVGCRLDGESIGLGAYARRLPSALSASMDGRFAGPREKVEIPKSPVQLVCYPATAADLQPPSSKESGDKLGICGRMGEIEIEIGREGEIQGFGSIQESSLGFGATSKDPSTG